jgi:hypothetical protein
MSFEASLKALATVIYASYGDGGDEEWKLVVFGSYAAAALAAVILYGALVLPMASATDYYVVDEASVSMSASVRVSASVNASARSEAERTQHSTSINTCDSDRIKVSSNSSRSISSQDCCDDEDDELVDRVAPDITLVSVFLCF